MTITITENVDEDKMDIKMEGFNTATQTEIYCAMKYNDILKSDAESEK